MVFILLVVLHFLINVPVLLRGGIFQVILVTNVPRFDIEVTDDIPSSFLCKTCLWVFSRATVVSASLLSLVVFHVRLVVIQ